MVGRATPETAESHVLGPQEAARLWNWVLARQGLTAHTRRATVEEIADVTLGLHAARLPSPYATVAARASDAAVPMTLFSPTVRSRLVTVRCMRKTLHALPLDLASVAHAATLRFRERDALRGIVNAGYTEEGIATAVRALVELLGEAGPMFHRDIESRLASTAIPVPVTRLAVKLAWERGTLTYVNQTRGWNREVRTFALTTNLYPGFDTGVDSGTAVARLMAAYVDRYGPVSIRDATWWSALSRTAVVEGLERAGVKLVELLTPWGNSPVYMSADRFREFSESLASECVTGVNLLAHEDVALKAYFETRSRYLGDLVPSAAFNQIGEVLPTVVANGRVVGAWAWDGSAAQVRFRLSGMVSSEQRKEIRAAATHLAAVLRSGLHRIPG